MLATDRIYATGSQTQEAAGARLFPFPEEVRSFVKNSILSKGKELDLILIQERKIVKSDRTTPSIITNDDLRNFGETVMLGLAVERLACIHFNRQFEPISIAYHSNLMIDRLEVKIRRIVHDALNENAYWVILVHNHPSGDSQPSEADIKFTTSLSCALRPVDINLAEHLIVAANGSFSMRGHDLI